MRKVHCGGRPYVRVHTGWAKGALLWWVQGTEFIFVLLINYCIIFLQKNPVNLLSPHPVHRMLPGTPSKQRQRPKGWKPGMESTVNGVSEDLLGNKFHPNDPFQNISRPPSSQKHKCWRGLARFPPPEKTMILYLHYFLYLFFPLVF